MKITKENLQQLGFEKCSIQGGYGFDTPNLVDYIIRINNKDIIAKHNEEYGDLYLFKKYSGTLRGLALAFDEAEAAIKEYTGVEFKFNQQEAKDGIQPDILILILQEELKRAPEKFERKNHAAMYVTNMSTFEEWSLYQVRYSTIYPWPIFAGGGYVNEYKIENDKAVFLRQVSSHIS